MSDMLSAGTELRLLHFFAITVGEWRQWAGVSRLISLRRLWKSADFGQARGLAGDGGLPALYQVTKLWPPSPMRKFIITIRPTKMKSPVQMVRAIGGAPHLAKNQLPA